MRIAVLCNDTRGGVQPYVALAMGLRQAGHDVRAVAPSDLAPMFSQLGIPTAALSGSIQAVLRGSGGVAERGLLTTMRFAAQELPARIEEWTRQTLAACDGVDILTGGVGGMVIGLSVAEKLNCPFIETHLHPVGAPTAEYPGALIAWTPKWLGPKALRFSHHITEAIVWAPFKRAMTQARENVLGLRGRSKTSRNLPVLYGFSRHVLPVAQGLTSARHVTGYWSLPTQVGWAPPQRLSAFLDLPGPVVSIGFGSMASQDPHALARLVRGAARDAGVRVILLAGWGGLGMGDPDGTSYCIDEVPHDWLFRRMAAVVHHGGAGTTGAAMTAGVPAVVIPFTMDQPFWAQRAAHLGVSPPPIPRRR